MQRRWRFPVLLLAAGVALAAGGVGWAAAAGILLPDLDPTPEMRAHAAFHHRIVSALLLGGLTAGTGGLLWGAALLAGALRRRAASSPRGRP